MVVHGVTDGGSDTVETTIVYGVQTVQDTTLHWFQAVIDVRNGTVLNDVGRVFDIVVRDHLAKLVVVLCIGIWNGCR